MLNSIPTERVFVSQQTIQISARKSSIVSNDYLDEYYTLYMKRDISFEIQSTCPFNDLISNVFPFEPRSRNRYIFFFFLSQFPPSTLPSKPPVIID